MSKNGTPKTSAAEIASLQSLTQKSTAWLLGFRSARSLGERVDCPRNEDLTYDCREVFRWWQKRKPTRVEPADLNTFDKQQIVNLSIEIDTAVARDLPQVVALFERLEDDHGQAGQLGALALLLKHFRDLIAEDPDSYRRPTKSEIRAFHEAKCEEKLAEVGLNCLEKAYRCQNCNRVELDGTWKTVQLPPGWHEQICICEQCDGA